MSLKDEDLWSTLYRITFMKENYTYNHYDKLVDVVNKIERIDFRFSALIEIANFSAGEEDNKPFEKARRYLNELLKDKNPNFALTGMINYMKRYCTIKDGKYILDYSKCYENLGTISLLVRVASYIEGGDKNLRNEAYEYCKMLMDHAEKHKDDDYSEYEKHGIYYD